jgi:hypothetical protein
MAFKSLSLFKKSGGRAAISHPLLDEIYLIFIK